MGLYHEIRYHQSLEPFGRSLENFQEKVGYPAEQYSYPRHLFGTASQP